MPEKLAPIAIAPEYASVLTTQSYEKLPSIDGVRLLDLRLMQDDGGSFAELIRLDEHGHLLAFPEFQVRQSSYSLVLPGAIKAFHLHFHQDDVWFVPPTDRLLVGLLDCRADSQSTGVSQRIVLGGGRAQLLFIPRGVAHGGGNLGLTPITILYFVNQHFNLTDPDERRIPWDILGPDFWKMTPG
jgi:dTDP-4-dehydrorhamnose 3,5-epimerase